MGIRQFLALVVLGAINSSYGVGAQGRSVKKSITVYHLSSIQKKKFALPSEPDRDQAINSLLELKAYLSKEFPLQLVASQPDLLSIILAQTAILISRTSVDTLMPSVAGCHAVVDRAAPSDFYGNYIWPAALYLVPISSLSAVALGCFGKIRSAAGLSVIAGMLLIGVLAQPFRMPYYEAWKKNRPAEVKIAEAHEFGKHFLYALTALKEGRLEANCKDTITTIVEYDQPAKS